jgi:hypothetical protein
MALTGSRIPSDFICNFYLHCISAVKFIECHKYISERFLEKHGVRLEVMVYVLLSISNIFHVTEKYLYAKDDENRSVLLRDLILNSIQRGYRVLDYKKSSLALQIQKRLKVLHSEFDVTHAEIESAIDKLTLTRGSQNKVSLWSGGPRFTLTPLDNNYIADMQGLPKILYNLFVGVIHSNSHNQRRGMIFEETFNEALKFRGWNTIRGKLRVDDKERELDAGVVIENTLYIFECFSSERPLDYEIGCPKTLSRRQQLLEEKIDQVLSLAVFLKANPTGTNYDFKSVQAYVPLVVSPFEEWMWDRSERLWLSDGIPRILSASEALAMLKRLSCSPESK